MNVVESESWNSLKPQDGRNRTSFHCRSLQSFHLLTASHPPPLREKIRLVGTTPPVSRHSQVRRLDLFDGGVVAKIDNKFPVSAGSSLAHIVGEVKTEPRQSTQLDY